MELRQYWDIIRRRIWIVAALTLGALIISVVLQLQPAGAYEATARLWFEANPAIPKGVAPDKVTLDLGQASDLTLQTAYLIDDIQRLVDDPSFRRQLYATLNNKTLTESLQPDFSVKYARTQQVFSIQVSASEAEYAQKVANEITRRITAPDGVAFQIRNTRPDVKVLQTAAITERPSLARDLLFVALRTLLGTIAGLAIIFLLAYLDNRIYEPDDLELRLGLPILGEIPSEQAVARKLRGLPAAIAPRDMPVVPRGTAAEREAVTRR